MSKVRELRKRRGVTQGQLSKQSGVPQSTISRIERGIQKYGSSSQHLMKIAKALNISITDLLSELDDSEEVKLA